MRTAKRLWPLAGGIMSIAENLVFAGGRPEMIQIPLPCYLIEHDYGLVLFDASLDPEAWEVGPRAVYDGKLLDFLPIDCPPGNRLDQQIAKAGFRVEDVTHVVLSHTHLDHTGGLYLFPKAQFYASVEELRYAFWPHPFAFGMHGTKDLERVRSCSWNLVSEDLDLFGDGSIQILQTPGHTPGHLSMLVRLGSQAIVLGMDIGHAQKNLEGLPCIGDMNALQTWQSIQRIKQISAAHLVCPYRVIRLHC